MYSIVLAAMMTAAPASPDWCWKCHGCCSGCYGCYGCYGSCSGCYGCYGCCGGCYGCCGGCWGCYGCKGYIAYSSCYGCCSCYGGVVGGIVVTPAPATAPAPAEKKTSMLPNQAQLVVQLPPDSKLYVDGQLSTVASTPKRLITPELRSGRDYTYTLKVETVRNGETVSASKDVVFRAGEVKEVDFRDIAGKASAKVTVQLPNDAKLYVDGVLCPEKSGKRVFETPELPVGPKYYYNMRAEIEQDGQVKSESRQVVVEAGKRVEVEFGNLTAVRTASR